MDFRFTDEEEGFRTEVKAFLKTELPKNWEEQFDSESELSLVASGDFAKGFQKKLADRHWLALPWPVEYGGLKATGMQQMIINQGMSHSRAPTGVHMGGALVWPSLTIYGNTGPYEP